MRAQYYLTPPPSTPWSPSKLPVAGAAPLAGRVWMLLALGTAVHWLETSLTSVWYGMEEVIQREGRVANGRQSI